MKERIAEFSILANALLALGKLIVGAIANSSLVFADGLHSVTDIFASTIGYIGINIAKKPVDKEHPYGHYKFEVLGGLIITIILLLTGVYIIWEAINKFQQSTIIDFSYVTIGVMTISAIINEVMARLCISYGKKENSVSLLSDGIHFRADVYASIAIIIGLFLAQWWPYIDPALTILIGVYIIKESFTLGKEAIDSLLDVSAGEEIESQIKSIAKKQNIEITSLKTQKKGSAITANIEIALPKTINVEEATHISHSLRKKLIDKIEGMEYVAIQITSHDVETDFYKPQLTRGFGWQKRKYQNTTQNQENEFCICKKCGYMIPHKRGIPCAQMQCPHCNTHLTKKGNV